MSKEANRLENMKNTFFIYILTIVIIFFGACTEKYFDYDIKNEEPLLIVEANINNKSYDQVVIISTSGSLEYPGFHGLTGCSVVVIDNDGNEFNFTEDTKNPGYYRGIIEAEYFVNGRSFKLYFKTYDGVEYESEFETYLLSGPVDSLYYELVQTESNGDAASEQGVQFYIDISSDQEYARNYKWTLEESYKYRSTWPIKDIFSKNEGIITDRVPNYNKYYCYQSQNVKGIYIASTNHLTENTYLKKPLNFVNNQSQRLFFTYCLTIEQYSLSDEAYEYWEKLEKNTIGSGGLLDKQPVNVYGNVTSISNPDEKVLGYFSVSDYRMKRIFAENIASILNFDSDQIFCSQSKLDWTTFGNRTASFTDDDYPYYLPPNPEYDPQPDDGIYVADQGCFDCTMKGGTVTPPDFWPETKK